LRIPVALADSLGGLLVFDEQEVEFFADVQEFTEGSRVLKVQVRDAPPHRRVSFSPPTVTVRYRVPLSMYDEANNSEGFVAFVPYEEIRADTTGVLYPKLDYPDHLQIRDTRMQPDALRYYNVLGDG
jgi:hypothetical protein